MKNVHVKDGTRREDWLQRRIDRDATLTLPDRMLAALQINLRGGRLPEIRFSTGLPLKVERFLATGVVTGAFVIAYPRRAFWIAAGAVVLVTGLEALQYLVPGRHGSAVDAAVKVLGSLAGVLGGRLAAAAGHQRNQPG